MALLLTAAVVAITIYTGGLFWLIFLIPILIITAIQNPQGTIWFILFISGGVVLVYLFSMFFNIYNKKVITPC